MVFHRHHHGPLHAVRNIGWSGDEQKISTWHAASHHALLFGYQTTPVSRARPFHQSERAPAPGSARCDRPILSVRGRRDQAFKWLDRGATADHTALFSAIRARGYPVPVLDRPRQVGVWHIQKNDQGRSRREAVALAGIRIHPVDGAIRFDLYARG